MDLSENFKHQNEQIQDLDIDNFQTELKKEHSDQTENSDRYN